MANPPHNLAASPSIVAHVRLAWIRPLANRNFRLLWLGEGMSVFGDQFYFVALPWLVFQMTGSSLAFGTVLMAAGIPRALLMLVGGVFTDRFSSRTVMIISNLLRFIFVVLLVLLIAGQTLQLWMLYVIAFCFGFVDAFFYPAYRAMIPQIVEHQDLQASNSLMLGTTGLAETAGPSIAGVLVSSVGVLLSFVFDALTFLFTSVMLLLMRPAAQPQQQSSPETALKPRAILSEIGEMLSFVRRDPRLRTIALVVAAVNFLFSGTLVVGTATLGRVRFVEGSAAFGVMLSSFSVGMLIGLLLAGILQVRRPGLISLLLVATEGVFLIGIAYAQTLVVACGLYLLIGIGAGFGNVNVITMTQKYVDKAMIGRVMSLIVLAEVGLKPISNAVAGILGDLNVTVLFVLAGGLLTLVALLATTNPEMRAVEE